jgi:erythromycin esterase-like protein
MPKGGKREGAGRKKGFAALEAEKAREIIAKKLADSLEPIVNKAIKQAEEGDRFAREWLLDRAYGRVPQAVELPDGTGEILIKWQK